MAHTQKIASIFLLCSMLLTSCWAPRCPMKSCHVTFEHKHEGSNYRGGSFITARKHWIWERWGGKKEFNGKKDKSGKTKYKKLLPGERVDFSKPIKQ